MSVTEKQICLRNGLNGEMTVIRPIKVKVDKREYSLSGAFIQYYVIISLFLIIDSPIMRNKALHAIELRVH